MIGRRSLVVSSALACLLVMVQGPAESAGATPEGASAFVSALGDATVTTLADQSLSKEARIEELHRLFVEGFDIVSISLFALGPHRREASKNQLREYVTLFKDFIVKSYAAQFGEYEGETLRVTGTRAAGARDVVVQSEIVRPGRAPVRVDWRVRETAKGYKIIDVIVEGISMAITQRDEFASFIRSNGGTFEGLLTALREKAATAY